MRHRVAKAASGSLWTPTSLGVALNTWLSPRDAATVTSSGGTSSQITDKSGNGHTYSQATATNQPAYGTRTINGHLVLDFDGVDNFMTGTSTTLAQPFTVAAVMQTDSIAAVTQRVFGNSTSSSRGVGLSNTGKWNINYATALISANGDTSPHAFIWIVNGASSVIRVDGVVDTSGNAGGGGIDSAAQLGRHQTSSYFNGGLGDLVVASGALSGTDLSNLETFLRTLAGT